MPSLKLTKSAVDTARPNIREYELRNTIVASFYLQDNPCRAQDLHAFVSNTEGGTA